MQGWALSTIFVYPGGGQIGALLFNERFIAPRTAAADSSGVRVTTVT